MGPKKYPAFPNTHLNQNQPTSSSLDYALAHWWGAKVAKPNTQAHPPWKANVFDSFFCVHSKRFWNRLDILRRNKETDAKCIWNHTKKAKCLTPAEYQPDDNEAWNASVASGRSSNTQCQGQIWKYVIFLEVTFDNLISFVFSQKDVFLDAGSFGLTARPSVLAASQHSQHPRLKWRCCEFGFD